jgi:hypothetical protein
MSNIQISEELFSRLCAYHLLDRREPEQEQAIKAGLQKKLTAIQRRTDYAKLINRQQERERSCEN